MRVALALAALAAAVVAGSAPAGGAPPAHASHLRELDAASFDATIATGGAVLVEFFAPWCSACKTILPELERAADIAANLSMPVVVARVDASEYKEEVADRYGVGSLPAFLLFRGGAHQTFPTLTTAEGYVAGLGKLLDLGIDYRPVKVFGPEADTQAVAQWIFWRGNPEGAKLLTTAVLYTPPGLTGAAAEHAAALDAAFTAAAGELLRYSSLRVAQVTSPGVIADFELPADAATLVVYTEHDEGRAEFDGPLEGDAVVDFIVRRDVPFVTSVWHRNLQAARRRVPLLALFFVTGRQAEHAPTVTRLRTALNEVTYALERKGLIRRGEFTLGIVDGKKYASWLEHFELDAHRTPSLVVENTTTGQLYRMPDFVDAAVAPPVPEGYEPSPFLPAAVQEAVRAGRPAAPKPAEPAADGSFVHDLPEDPLTWVDVPSAAVEAWLEAVVLGTVKSHKTTTPPMRGGGSKPAAAAAPSGDDAPHGKDEL